MRSEPKSTSAELHVRADDGYCLRVPLHEAVYYLPVIHLRGNLARSKYPAQIIDRTSLPCLRGCTQTIATAPVHGQISDHF